MENREDKNKLDSLRQYLCCLGRVAIAFSGGVDSTFLLKVAHDVLGENALALTACSCTFPERELKESQAFCLREGITQILIESRELEIEGFSQNPKNRCYLCKHELFEKMWETARELDIPYIAEGSNLDDNGDYRPGLAAVAELNVKSPLRDIGFTKQEIRTCSRTLGLPTWQKPSFACLSSRFPYGETITPQKLSMVDRAEQLLIDMGFSQVRVRIHGQTARIEILPSEFDRLLERDNRKRIIQELKSFGFTYVSMDMEGYRTGSMNETFRKP